MDNLLLRRFVHVEREPSLQLWRVQVRAEHADRVKAAFEDGILAKAPRFMRRCSESFVADSLLVKRARAGKAADFLRRYLRCQGKREFLGSMKLREIGVMCPEPVGYAYNLVPTSKFDSLLISQFLPGGISGDEFLEKGKPGREEVLERALNDLRVMLAHNLIHKDAQLSNILVEESKEPVPCWIDNDLERFGEKDRPAKAKAVLRRWFKRGSFTPEERHWFETELLAEGGRISGRS